MLVLFTWNLTSAEIELRVNCSYLDTSGAQRSEEDRALALDKVVDVRELVLRHVEVRVRANELQPSAGRTSGN